MSKADQLFVTMCEDILDHGFSTEGQKVRPHWEDGTPAYTIKNFGVVNRYDLSEEFPALTLRRTAVKTAVEEMLWIWQRKSNNIRDLAEMGLEPCAYSVTFNVTGDRLNAILNQRSQDILAANNWNVVQYAVLVYMMAQVTGFRPGELVHVIADAHIYDRHVDIIRELIRRPQYPAPKFRLNPEVKDFYDFTPDDVILEDYQHGPQVKNIPVAV